MIDASLGLTPEGKTKCDKLSGANSGQQSRGMQIHHPGSTESFKTPTWVACRCRCHIHNTWTTILYEYVDDENVEEEEIPVTASSAITRSSTSNVNSANSTATTEATTTVTTKRKTESMNNFSNQNDERAVQPSSQYNEYKLGKNDYPAMSSHSVLKWQHLGSRENLQRTRNNMSHFRSTFSKTPEALAARRHADRVAAEGSCQRPKSRVISVRDVYRDTSVSYKPHCVILYRCSHDTGCCNSESLTCSEKHSQQVEFYFQTNLSNKTESMNDQNIAYTRNLMLEH
ncbi:hypothetical protein TKK_0010121 [Trichogramma kaykai]